MQGVSVWDDQRRSNGDLPNDAVAITVVILELPLLQSQRNAAGLVVLQAFSREYGHHWLPGLTCERAAAYGQQCQHFLGLALKLLTLDTKELERIQKTMAAKIEMLEEREDTTEVCVRLRSRRS